MIPRKENITRVEVQGENFCPVKSRRDSSLGQRISSFPALQLEGSSQEGLQSQQKAKSRDKATPGPLSSAF